ncbi:hydroxyacid oxidase 2 [Sigmodon hispidus]
MSLSVAPPTQTAACLHRGPSFHRPDLCTGLLLLLDLCHSHTLRSSPDTPLTTAQTKDTNQMSTNGKTAGAWLGNETKEEKERGLDLRELQIQTFVMNHLDYGTRCYWVGNSSTHCSLGGDTSSEYQQWVEETTGTNTRYKGKVSTSLQGRSPTWMASFITETGLPLAWNWEGDNMAGPEMSLMGLADFKTHAQKLLSKTSWDFIEGEADEGITYNDNIEAFKRIRLRPRYLRDVSEVDTRTTIQGQEIKAPICISPTAFHSVSWPDGERGTARAAQEASVCYITSTYTSCILEDIVAAAPRGFQWFQLAVQSDWDLNKHLIRRVEVLGFKALVITIDAPVIGKRRRDLRNQLNLEANIMLKDLRSPEGSITQLPIILKGILTKEDAELALKHNVQGIFVSNHGGRQLDEVPASIDALAEVVAAVKGKVEVYMDGGVRTGNDVLKALALGAKCVFLGRPILWGLACKGRGVHRYASWVQGGASRSSHGPARYFCMQCCRVYAATPRGMPRYKAITISHALICAGYPGPVLDVMDTTGQAAAALHQRVGTHVGD